MASWAVDDEFGNQITTGLDSLESALQCGRRYLAPHRDAPAVVVYEDYLDSNAEIFNRADFF